VKEWIIENGKWKIEVSADDWIMENVIEEKSFQFSIRIVRLYQYLSETKKEYVLSKQLLRAGTSIGANVAEAQQAQSKADFTSKTAIALKETTETKYWIRLLHATEYLSNAEYHSILSDCTEIEKLLTSIVKTSKSAP
jgi:four helix bundle protein